jgi:hypothetical protein
MLRAIRTFVIHEILGKFFQIALIVEDFYQLVVMIIRDDGIFRVSGDVNNLFTYTQGNVLVSGFQ